MFFGPFFGKIRGSYPWGRRVFVVLLLCFLGPFLEKYADLILGDVVFLLFFCYVFWVIFWKNTRILSLGTSCFCCSFVMFFGSFFGKIRGSYPWGRRVFVVLLLCSL